MPMTLSEKLQQILSQAEEGTTPGPWLRGKWDILPEDRDARGYGTAWTFMENEHGDDYAHGPLGRKSKEIDRIIEGYGYECDGVGFSKDADERLFLASRVLVPALARALGRSVEALSFIKDGCLVPPDGGSPKHPEDSMAAAKEAIAEIEKLLEVK